MPEKPKFNPNVPYQEATGSVPSAKKPAFDPNKKFEYAAPELREGDKSVITPKYKTPQELEVDSAVNFIKEKGGRNGSTILDSEIDVLRDVLKDSRSTQEQKRKAILTIQGYDDKHDDNNTMYYMKKEDNGVYMPTPLAYGEKPPKGYKVASVWGNEKESENDSWYTDLGKSLANGVLGAAQGVVDVAQVGNTLVTGEESKYLNNLGNTAEALKFKKDSDLNAPILNTEGITQWSDLLDKDRFDISPKSLWGTLNMAAESLTEFAGGTKGAMTIMKNSPKAAIFTGSFMSQLGDNLDNAEEAGLKGRDKSAVASAITAPMAALDAFYGLDGKLMSTLFQNEKREMLKNVIKSVDKDAMGNITENGFKQLTKQATVGYTELAKKGVKEIVGDVVGEGSQEALQDFTQKAGEQLWDKMTPNERGQFGTDAFNAKSFGDYINSFATGLVSGAPMAVGTQVLRSKHDEQSINAYERVKQGPEAVKALKVDLDNALKNNDINQSEYEQAIFKIDSYDKYQQETKDVNLKPEDEKKAFELSFQIQGLKTEIPTNENEISKLEPINRAKVESKQKQVKELQSELNDIIRRGEIKGEPVVPKKEEERIQNEKEKEFKAEEAVKKDETDAKLQQKEPIIKTPKAKEVKVKSEYEPVKFEDDKRTYEEVTPEEFNEGKFPSRSRHRMLRKELSNKDKYPSGEISGKLIPRTYTYNNEVKNTYEVQMADGKKIRLSSSMLRPEGFRGHMRTERLKGNAEGLPVAVKVVDLNEIPADYKMPEGYKSNKKILKVYQKSDGKFLGWAKETHKGGAEALDKTGQSLYNEQEIDLIKHLETVNETPATEKELEGLRQPLPKAPVKQRAAEATSKIVEEAKAKVRDQKGGNKVTLNNISDIIKNGYGRLSVSKNGENIAFDKFDIVIDNDTKTAEVVFVQKKDRVANKGIGLESYIELGERLKEKGITLQSLGQPQLIGGRYVWDTLVKNGLAKRIATGSYEYTGKNETENKSKSPSELSLSELKELPNRENFDETNKQALVELNSINFNNKQSVKDGISKILEIINNKFIPENKVEQVLKTKEKLIGNSDYYSKEYLEKYIQYTTKDFSELTKEQKESIKTEDTKALGLKIKRKVEGYNRLSFEQKKTEFGVNLRKEIDKDVKEFGGSLKPLNRSNIQLLDSEGKQVKKDSVRREQSVIDNEKAIAIKKKNALNITPTSIPQYLAMVIGSKGQFAESLTKEIPNVPSMMKDFKKGYTLESLLQGYKDRANLTDESISESDFNSEAMDFLKEYLIEGGRDLAIKYAVESYEKEVNGGYTDKQIKELEDYAEANGVTEEELSDIKEVAQNINNEEYKTITEKIESKNENERNEQLADEIKNDYFGDENGINDVFIKDESKKSEEEKDITRNESENEPFQKESGKPSVYSQKVIDKLQKALPKVKIVFDANLKAAGKWSPSTNTITINPEYAGKDTAIHEAGHILIDAMGYENKIIQQAVKQLRDTDLYDETKQRYPELNEEQLDKEVLAEAIGREGADIFDKAEDRSKFKAYLDYIFDWLKQKLGLDKNVAKSLAKQIIGGVKTKDLKGTEKGTEQLQKEKKKNPIGVRALSFAQYAAEHGFSYEAETDKMDEAKVMLQEATEEMELAKEDADNAMTDAEVEVAEKVLAEKETAYKEARKAYAIAGKRTFEYKQYKKDFNAIQEILKEKDLSKYSVEELQDLISRIHAFDNKAAKVVKEEAMLKLAFLVRKEMQAVHAKRDNYIESVADSKDITSLQKMLLHISHFTENQPEMQKLSLEFGKAVMDKISDASTRKDIHEKLARKLITEENKRLGIVGAASNRFSSDSAKYFEWMDNGEGGLLTVDEAKAKGYSEARINYLKFTRETIADFKDDLTKDNYENVVMDAIKVDKGFTEAFKSEGLLEAFSYYLGGGGYNLGKVRIEHNGTVKSYAEIEKEILVNADKKSITSILNGLWELLKANVKARRQLKKGYNVDESINPLEVRVEAEYSLNSKGQLVSKFDKPRSKDRGYSKDFYRAMNQFIDESAHTKHMSKIMPLVESVEYLNKKGYAEKGIMPKKNVAKWIEDWKALHIFKEPYVNDPVLDASIKFMRKLVASTTMWFNLPANAINVAVGNYNSWRQENGKTLAKGNARLFGGKGERSTGGVVNKYALDIIKKYNIVNQDYDSQPTLRATNIFSKMATIGTQLGEYQIQGSLALGLMPDNVYNSFEYTKDKYGNDVLTVKEEVNEDDIKKEILKVKNRVTDIQGKYPDEDRRNIMRGEIGKAVFQFKVWIPDWYKERFAPEYYNAFGDKKEGTLRALYKDGFKKIYTDLKKGNFKELSKNKAFMSNIKGLTVIGALLALKYRDDDDEDARGKASTFDNLLGQILFILDPEQDKYMVSNPVAALGKTKDFINAAEALITLDEKAWEKTKRVLPANKIEKIVDFGKKVVE